MVREEVKSLSRLIVLDKTKPDEITLVRHFQVNFRKLSYRMQVESFFFTDNVIPVPVFQDLCGNRDVPH